MYCSKSIIYLTFIFRCRTNMEILKITSWIDLFKSSKVNSLYSLEHFSLFISLLNSVNFPLRDPLHRHKHTTVCCLLLAILPGQH